MAVSTLAGAVGVAGLGLLIAPASWAAEAVLWIARGASVWPQLGAFGAAGLGAVLVVVARWRMVRSAVVVVAAALALLYTVRGPDLPDPGVVVLDVGQGDAILIHSRGRFALVDGGPDELLLVDKLRQYGVTHLDLVVLSHVHADHATGLAALAGRFAIGEVWVASEPHETAASRRFLESVAGVEITTPEQGETVRLGELAIVVEGPVRRYASPNDQSMVLVVEGPARSMLLAGDVETFAQADLMYLRADVLKVPHQGAATSDPDWLALVGADVAVISVGPNQFGHPAPWVIDTLRDSGATVIRTDQAGDVAVPLD